MSRIQGMREFMKHDKGANGSGSPRRGDGANVGGGGVANMAGATSPPSGGHGATQSALQSPVRLVPSRQATAEAARLPLPRSGRYAGSSGQSYPPITSHHLQSHAMQRTRTVSDHGRDNGGHGHEAMWEDSTVASMWDENDSRAASDRYGRVLAHHGRHYSENSAAQYPQPQQQQHEGAQSRREEHLPFVIAENGALKVVERPGPSATTLNTSVQSGLITEQSAGIDDPYHVHRIEETPTKAPALKHKRLPHRDARDTQKRSSYAEREVALGNTGGVRQAAADEISDSDSQDLAALDARLQPHNLHAQRSTIFHDLTPVLDEVTNWNSSEAVQPQRSQQSPDSRGLPTPRPSRQTVGPAAQSRAEPTLRRTSSTRHDKPLAPSRKRALSPDYDDHQLHSMSSAELRREAFDFDPKRVALQAAVSAAAATATATTAVEAKGGGGGGGEVVPPDGDSSLEARLRYHRDRDSIAQHTFFTQCSVADWEASGDWFLDEMGAVLRRMREARQAKRAVIRRFEEEIWAREEGVRCKIESIGRTLGELRQEGRSLMEGKDMDL